MANDEIQMLFPAALGSRTLPYSPGAMVERPSAIVFTAGQTGVTAHGELAGDGGIAAQTRQVFENLGQVLAEANMDFSNVLMLRNYMVNPDDMPGFRVVRDELYLTLFPNGNFPANTLLFVARLARPEYLVEIEAVAART